MLQTVKWLEPFARRALVSSCEGTQYFAAIMNAEINFSEDDGSADVVVFFWTPLLGQQDRGRRSAR